MKRVVAHQPSVGVGTITCPRAGATERSVTTRLKEDWHRRVDRVLRAVPNVLGARSVREGDGRNIPTRSLVVCGHPKSIIRWSGLTCSHIKLAASHQVGGSGGRRTKAAEWRSADGGPGDAAGVPGYPQGGGGHDGVGSQGRPTAAVASMAASEIQAEEAEAGAAGYSI